LVDPTLIESLYKAARSGVQVDMVVRGICTATTHQKVFKKDIRGISIVDEYLEHARVIIFNNNNDPIVYISSADWMVRNLDHRVEVTCPIISKTFSQELIDIMEIQLQENVKARVLNNLQDNEYLTPENKEQVEFRSQLEIYKYLQNKEYP
jgi:polyphosphate kinase